MVGRKNFTRPRQDSNLQSSDPKSDALSIRPRGRRYNTTFSPPTTHHSCYTLHLCSFSIDSYIDVVTVVNSLTAQAPRAISYCVLLHHDASPGATFCLVINVADSRMRVVGPMV